MKNKNLFSFLESPGRDFLLSSHSPWRHLGLVPDDRLGLVPVGLQGLVLEWPQGLVCSPTSTGTHVLLLLIALSNN